jgi:hypothetical protein
VKVGLCSEASSTPWKMFAPTDWNVVDGSVAVSVADWDWAPVAMKLTGVNRAPTAPVGGAAPTAAATTCSRTAAIVPDCVCAPVATTVRVGSVDVMAPD